MGKIIIRHADRVTEHALPMHSLVIGRDPECDLFFADKKLSRRHARLERSGDSMRLVDLGSRNGCWVNEVQISEKVLEPGDNIRLGSLHIDLELDPPKAAEPPAEPEGAGDSATVVLPAAEPPPVEEDSTVVLSADAAPPEPDPEDSSTVILSGPSDLPSSPPPPPVPEAEESSTVVLSASPAPPLPDPEESGTVMLETPDLEASSSAPDPEESGTVMLESPASLEPPAAAGPDPDESSTVVLTKGSLADASPDDSHTVVLPAAAPPEPEPEPELEEDDDPTLSRDENADRTVVVGASPGDAQSTAEVVLGGRVEPVPETFVAREPDPMERTSHSAPPSFASPSPMPGPKYIALALVVAIVVLAAIALPLLRSRSQAVSDETLLRAEVLVELLAAKNQPALVEARRDSLDAVGVSDQPGVVGAFVLAPSGEVLFSSAGASPSDLLDELAVEPSDLRAPRSFEAESGVIVYATPVKGEGRRVGIAALRYDPSAAAAGSTVPLVALGGLALLLGVLAAVFVARRWAFSELQGP